MPDHNIAPAQGHRLPEEVSRVLRVDLRGA
jgi:hypothetical protein